MESKIDLENRIIPYKMLYEAVSNTHRLVEGILPEHGIPSLKLGLNYVKTVLNELSLNLKSSASMFKNLILVNTLYFLA